ncbi:hypothetical protein ABTE37_19940, partial [Acinetobacter baumannii]
VGRAAFCTTHTARAGATGGGGAGRHRRLCAGGRPTHHPASGGHAADRGSGFELRVVLQPAHRHVTALTTSIADTGIPAGGQPGD